MLARVIVSVGIGSCGATQDEDVNVMLLQTKTQVTVKKGAFYPGCKDEDPDKCKQIAEGGFCSPDYATLCPLSCYDCMPPLPKQDTCEDRDPHKCKNVVEGGFCGPAYAEDCQRSCFGCSGYQPPPKQFVYEPGYGLYRPFYGTGPFGKDGELLGGGHWEKGRPYSSMDEPYERYMDGVPCKPCPPGCCYDFEKPPPGSYGGPYYGPHGPYYVPHGHEVHVDGFIEGDFHVEEKPDYHGPPYHGPPYTGPPYHPPPYVPGPTRPANDVSEDYSKVDWSKVGDGREPFLTDDGFVKPGEFCLGFNGGPMCDKGYMCVDEKHLEGPPVDRCPPGVCKCQPLAGPPGYIPTEQDYLNFAENFHKYQPH